MEISANNKPLAGLSLDLDNLWSYMKTHGDPGWEELPSYFDVLAPVVLEQLEKRELLITFFVVGQDAVLEKNKQALKSLFEAGHEFGNHSFYHEPWLHLYPIDKIRAELENTENALTDITGVKPVGFRGPGFSWSNDLIQVLHERNYLYDASSLPTFLGPIARAYYLKKSNFSKEEKEKRSKLFGTFKDGLRPVSAYWLNLNQTDKLLEIPVTTMPVFKVPFHLSYLIYLCNYSEMLMKLYLNFVLMLCRLTKTSPSFLLHPLDFLGGDKVPQLSFFPGMNMTTERKISIFHKVMDKLQKQYCLVNMSTFANQYQPGVLNKSVDLF